MTSAKETARKAVIDWQAEHARNLLSGPESALLVNAIAAAIQAEAEECAKVADEWSKKTCPEASGSIMDVYTSDAIDLVAAAIRNRHGGK